MDFMNFIVEKGIVLIPVLYVLGIIIKQTPKIPDWLIPYLLLGAGIVLSGFTIGWTSEGIIQGVLVTGATVLGNQIVKQTIERD